MSQRFAQIGLFCLSAIAIVIMFVTNAVSQQVESDIPAFISRLARDIALSNAGNREEFKDRLFESILLEFVRHDQTEAVEKLIKSDVSFDVRDADGNSAIHVAAENQSPKMLRLLVDAGLDVNALDDTGRSALFNVASSKNHAMAEILLDAGADVDGTSEHFSPLCTAAWYGQTQVVKLLLSHDANIEARDGDGNTALHKAVWQGNFEVVELLLENGSSKDAQNAIGQSVREMAIERWNATAITDSWKRNWGPEHIIGPPDATPTSDIKAWASLTADGQEEWLEVTYDTTVNAASVEIYENICPGAVNKITYFDAKGTESIAWSGLDPAEKIANGTYVSKIELKCDSPTKKLKIYIDSMNTAGWNEVDAVRLIDDKGSQQWASWVEASTCYTAGDLKLAKHRRVHQLIVGE